MLQNKYTILFVRRAQSESMQRTHSCIHCTYFQRRLWQAHLTSRALRLGPNSALQSNRRLNHICEKNQKKPPPDGYPCQFYGQLLYLRHSLMVKASDSEPGDPGSTPGHTTKNWLIFLLYYNIIIIIILQKKSIMQMRYSNHCLAHASWDRVCHLFLNNIWKFNFYKNT